MSETHALSAASTAFVRSKMQEPEPPPLTEAGAIKWLRENLFPNWFNAILTVVSLFVIYWVLAHVLPWMFYSIWDAGSLSECRAILGESARMIAWESGAVSSAERAIGELPETSESWRLIAEFLYNLEGYAGPLGGTVQGTQFEAWRQSGEIGPPLSSFEALRAELGRLGYEVGPRPTAACFAVIAERWPQLIFGFYPSELYWRPVFAFVLLGVAVAPILFFGLPRKMLWFSAAYPFVAFFLLWGGSIWAPLTAAAGFGVAFLLYKVVQPLAGNLVATLAALVGPVIWWLVLTGPIAGWLSGVAPIGLRYIESKQFGGFMLAVVIGLSGIVLSMPLGILLALGRQSNLFLINKISVTFIEVIRGVPLIVWLFTASLLLNYFLPPGTNFDLMLRVIIMVTLFSAAYIAEVIRGGLAALPRGQYEAADALGLDYWKAMRLIILPQALKISIPGIVNTFIGLFKDTTLVVFIGLFDPIGLTNAIRASIEWNGIYWELFIFIGIMFFCFCFFMSRYSQYLERKLRTDHR